jgi:hypothetical protein
VDLGKAQTVTLPAWLKVDNGVCVVLKMATAEDISMVCLQCKSQRANFRLLAVFKDVLPQGKGGRLVQKDICAPRRRERDQSHKNLHAFLRVPSEANKKEEARMAKTYNSGDSPVVTHLTTSPPVTSLSTAEQTGSAIFLNLWSYVEGLLAWTYYIDN